MLNKTKFSSNITVTEEGVDKAMKLKGYLYKMICTDQEEDNLILYCKTLRQISEFMMLYASNHFVIKTI